MNKFLFIYLLVINSLTVFGQFAPEVGKVGTTAIYKDSSVFVEWGIGCTIQKGYQDISNSALGYVSVGDSTMALGKAGDNGVVSLGDGGSAIVTFTRPIKNSIGWDFAVFENSFSDNYLELGFVEVSSDGIIFFRFPATSNTQDTLQLDGFGSIDPAKVNNLAGKYRALYGTPFDLEELKGISGLNLNNVTHVRIVDVVGNIQNQYATYDMNGHKINDPWSTPFPSSGFDLDAIGIINSVTGITENPFKISQLTIYPNPVCKIGTINYFIDKKQYYKMEVTNMVGNQVAVLLDNSTDIGWQTLKVDWSTFNCGVYFVHLISESNTLTKKIIVLND